jgi:hypothetical protein
MGALVSDTEVGGIFEQLNKRFEPGHALTEMQALQKEFEVFKPGRDLKKSLGLLNIGPINNWKERRGFYKFLDGLKKAPSDRKGVNGHDRLAGALAEHLATPGANPIHFTCHSAKDDARLKVLTQRRNPLVYSTQEYLTISLPLLPVEKDKAKRKAAK